MDNSSAQAVPGWVTQPTQLLRALEFSDYFNDSFLHTTNHQDTASFRKSINQFLFWKRQLSPSLTPKTIIFTLLGAAGLESSSVMDVVLEASKVCDLSGAFEFFQAANPKFIGISFTNIIDRHAFITNFTYYKDCVIAYVPPVSDNSRAFSILWLPPLFNIDRVRTMLSHYSKHLSLQHATTKIAPNRFIRSSTVRGTITLKDGITFEQVPHLIPLPSPHLGHALLIINGRPPFCLKCLSHGHLRKECTSSKCSSCSTFHTPNVSCSKLSYAQRVSQSSPSINTYNWADDAVGEDGDTLSHHNPPTATLLSLHHTPLKPNTTEPSDSLQTYQDTILSNPLTNSIQDTVNLSLTSQVPTSTEKRDRTFSAATGDSSLFTNTNLQVLNDDDSRSQSSEKRRKKTHIDTTASIMPSPTPPQTEAPSPLLSSSTSFVTNPSNTASTSASTPTNILLDSPRSLSIKYTPFEQVFADSNQYDLLPFARAEMGDIFAAVSGDFYDSGSEGSSDSHMSTDQQSASSSITINRKRKGDTPSHDDLTCSSDPVPLETSDNFMAPTTSSHKASNTDTPSELVSDDASITNYKLPNALLPFLPLVEEIFTISADQATLLIASCPNQTITRETIKSFKALNLYGFTHTDIIEKPQVMHLKPTEIHRKTKILHKKLGYFTLSDLCQASRIEDKILNTGITKPLTFFSDN